MPWANVDAHSDANDMWHEWKEMFPSCVDKKHAPLNRKESVKNDARGLLVIYVVKPEEEISLKRRHPHPVIQPHGINISELETKQITQLSSQRNSMFLTT